MSVTIYPERKGSVRIGRAPRLLDTVVAVAVTEVTVEGVVLILLVDVVADRVVQIGAQIPALPVQAEVETAGQVRMRITDDGTVVGIHLAVTVEVFPLEVTYMVFSCRCYIVIITRLATANKLNSVGYAVRQRVVQHVFLTGVDTVVNIAVEHTYGLALGSDSHLGDTGRVEQVGSAQLGHLVLVPGSVGVDVVVHLADLVSPADGEVDTGVLDLALVRVRLGTGT